MRVGLASYLLSEADRDPTLDLWDVLQQRGREVDFLPGWTTEMASMLADYLASEFDVCLPGSRLGELGSPLVGDMTRHEAKVLRVQLKRVNASADFISRPMAGTNAAGLTTDWRFSGDRQAIFRRTTNG